MTLSERSTGESEACTQICAGGKVILESDECPLVYADGEVIPDNFNTAADEIARLTGGKGTVAATTKDITKMLLAGAFSADELAAVETPATETPQAEAADSENRMTG